MDLRACASARALHADERVACSVAYADAHAQQHAVRSLDAARRNPRGVGTSVKLRSCKVVTACAGERADVKMPLERCVGLCAGERALGDQAVRM